MNVNDQLSDVDDIIQQESSLLSSTHHWLSAFMPCIYTFLQQIQCLNAFK